MERVFRSALGSDLSTESETPQGQIIGGLAFVFAQADEVMVALGNSFSIHFATGRHLDDLCSSLGVLRLQETRSTVDVTLRGTVGGIVPAGSRAATSTGALFELISAAIFQSNGSIDAMMRSVSYGAVPAPVGGLTQIIDRINGWDSVMNTTPADLGRFAETDVEYRARYFRVLTQNARTSIDSIIAAVRAVTSVVDVELVENATASSITVQSIVIQPNSFLTIVRAPTTVGDDVAAAIGEAKPVGIATSGNQSATVGGRTIRYTYADEISITVAVTLAIAPEFPSDGVIQIRDAIVEYVTGRHTGTGLDDTELYGPIYSITGHHASALMLARVTGTDGVTTTDLERNQYLSIDATNIAVTIS